MASVVLSGDTSGSITVSAPAVSGSNTQTLVAATDTLAPVVRGTAITLTNQTGPEFTGIPSWVKRITLMFNGVSTNGTSIPQIQIGAGSYTTSGYLGSASTVLSTVGSANYSSGAILVNQAVATQVHYGAVRITNISGNNWVFDGVLGRSDAAATSVTGGVLALSGTLDRVRLYIDGTQQFDAGTINILYE
jgi:hypothetical protein